MKTIYRTISLVAIVVMLFSCEKVIQLDLPDGEALPYIDAWITTKPGVQTIKFLKAVNYQSTQEPAPVPGATITLTDLTSNTDYPFIYESGIYTYDPGAATSIGIVGHSYRLRIVYNGETFEATDVIKQNTTIDSLNYEYREAKDGDEAGYYAKLYARDLPGTVDYYWIRAFRNGQLNYYVSDKFSIDGAFSEGINDGFPFIPPFRDGISSGEKPYVKGDEVKVWIRSLSKAAYQFMHQVQEQLDNEGLFSRVLQNVPANMLSTTPGSSNKIYGWFGTVAETEAVEVIQ